jgi:hypothetical protein
MAYSRLHGGFGGYSTGSMKGSAACHDDRPLLMAYRS